MLQPVTGGNRPDVDCAHKFIVETIFTPDGELTSLERLVTAAFPVELALGLTTFSSWGPACIGGGDTSSPSLSTFKCHLNTVFFFSYAFHEP